MGTKTASPALDVANYGARSMDFYTSISSGPNLSSRFGVLQSYQPSISLNQPFDPQLTPGPTHHGFLHHRNKHHSHIIRRMYSNSMHLHVHMIWYNTYNVHNQTQSRDIRLIIDWIGWAWAEDKRGPTRWPICGVHAYDNLGWAGGWRGVCYHLFH